MAIMGPSPAPKGANFPRGFSPWQRLTISLILVWTKGKGSDFSIKTGHESMAKKISRQTHTNSSNVAFWWSLDPTAICARMELEPAHRQYLSTEQQA